MTYKETQTLRRTTVQDLLRPIDKPLNAPEEPRRHGHDVPQDISPVVPSRLRSYGENAAALAVLVLYWHLIFHSFIAGQRSFGAHHDNTNLIAPVFSRIADILSLEEWPLYIDSCLAGLELHNTAQFSVYYPFYPFHYAAMSTPAAAAEAIDWSVLCHILLGAFNTFVLCRVVGCGPWSSLCGAVVHCSARNTWIYGAWVIKIAPYSWLPLLLAGLVLFHRGRTQWGIATVVTSLTMITLASPSQPMIHALLLCAAAACCWTWLAFKRGSDTAFIAACALLVALTGVFLIASPVIVPTGLDMSKMIRWIGSHGSVVGNVKLPFEACVIDQESPLSLKYIVVGPSGDGFVGSSFIGWAAAVAMIAGLLLHRPCFFKGAFAAVAAYGLLSSYGTHCGLAYVNYMIPLVNKIREPSHHLILFVTGATVLAAFGAKAVQRRSPVFAIPFLWCLFLWGAYAQMEPISGQRYRAPTQAESSSPEYLGGMQVMTAISEEPGRSLVKCIGTHFNQQSFSMIACYLNGVVSGVDGTYHPQRFSTHQRVQCLQAHRQDLMRLAGVRFVVDSGTAAPTASVPEVEGAQPRYTITRLESVDYPTLWQNVPAMDNQFVLNDSNGAPIPERVEPDAVRTLLEWRRNDQAVTTLKISHAHRKYVVRADAPALFAADNFYSSHWRYRVDGKWVSSTPINVVRQAVALTPGEHNVEMFYRPRGLTFLYAASLCGLVLCAASISKWSYLQSGCAFVFQTISREAFPSGMPGDLVGKHVHPANLVSTSQDGVRAALAEWWSGTRNVELWLTLSWYEIVLRYRRSMLGPLWMTISMGLLLLGMGPLYATLFNIPQQKFFPHLTLGVIFWTFYSTSIADGCTVFTSSERYLKSATYPLSVFVWRNLSRSLIQLVHHMILFVPVALWHGTPVTPKLIFLIPGLLVALINLHAMTITTGLLCARYRDVGQIVASILQLLMFLTPVFWFPESLPDRAHFILYNPLAQLIDILRLPLLGAAPAPGTWWFLLCFTACNVVLAGVLYVSKHRRLIYWL
jgi:lipopolysaccharide transport system permease protein